MKSWMNWMVLASLLAVGTAQASATRVIDAAQINNAGSVITLPTSTATLCGKDETCTLTGKTISGASNTLSAIPTSAIAGSALSGTNTGDVTIGTANGLSLSGQQLSLGVASGSNAGALSASDFTTFSNKLSLSGGTMTGNIVLSGAQVKANGFASNLRFGGSGQLLMDSDSSITINSNGGASDHIFLFPGTGASIKVGSSTIQDVANPVNAQDAATKAYVDSVASSGPSIVGSTGSPTAITAAGGVGFSGSAYKNVNFLVGSGGAVTVTANPQIAAGTSVGQELTLIGTSDTNTVTLADGTGLSLNGGVTLANHSVIGLIWDGSVWVEQFRR